MTTEIHPESLLWLGFQGKSLPGHIIKLLQSGNLGGLILFSRNLGTPEEIINLTTEIQKYYSGDLPLPVGIDQEGGRVRRLSFVKWPSAYSLAQKNNPEFIKKIAAGMGKELDLLGFNVNFAPVLDVWTNPENKIIGDRAFGNTAEEVIKNAKAFITGFAQSGVLNCGKHFPGHGNTLLDSHKSLPVPDVSLKELNETHVKPFEELAPFLDFIMIAHVLYKNLDPLNPATFSPEILRIISKFNFSGLLISDDFEMGALQNFENSAVKSISAGSDMIMTCSSYENFMKIADELRAEMIDNKGFSELIKQKTNKLKKLQNKLKNKKTVSIREISEKHSILVEDYSKLVENM